MKRHFLVFFLFFVLTSIITYPLILNFGTYIPGFFSTDEPFGVLWEGWRIQYSSKYQLPREHAFMIGYPFGVHLYTSGYLLGTWLRWTVYNFMQPVLFWNIQIFLNLLLSAIFCYLLIFYLVRYKSIAFFGSIAFAFCPYQFARAWQHFGLTYNWLIPFCLLTAFLLREKLSKKMTGLFFVSILFVFSLEYAIMYFTVVALVSFSAYLFFYDWKTRFFKEKTDIKKDLKYLLGVAAIVSISFIILFPQFSGLIKNRLNASSHSTASAFNPYHRPFEDLFAQSAKPLSYLLPASVHPVFGKFTEQFIGSEFYGKSFTEHTLYLGWVPLVLAFAAVKKWRSRRKEAKLGTVIFGDSSFQREDFYIGFFIFLAIIAWLFSQPPWWRFGPVRIFMPSFFMYKILPMYRAYCRFGIVVMLAIAVLAGFGLKSILERLKTPKSKIVLTCLSCGLVLFEFWNWPPFKVIDVSKVPAVYYWLKNQPGDFAIAEYPLDADSPNEMYKFYQMEHERKMINGTIPGTAPNRVAKTITKLSEPNTAKILRWMGVKYVLVHHSDYLDTGLLEWEEELNNIPLNPGLKFIKSFPPQECPTEITCVQKSGQVDIYEVVAQGLPPKH